MKKRLLATLGSIWPLCASAQTSPPSYASASSEQQIRGRVVAFNGPYSLTVRDEKGYARVYNFHFHDVYGARGAGYHAPHR